MASGLDTPDIYANGANGTPVLTSDATLPIPPAPASSFDPAQFRTYLLALLPPVIGATVDEIEATLFDSEFDEKSTRFAAEGTEAIYIVKTRTGEPEGETWSRRREHTLEI
jgi:dynein heavy chain 1